MVGGVSSETCWALYKYGIINFDILLHLVRFFVWRVMFTLVYGFGLKAIRYEVLNWTVAQMLEICSTFNIFAIICNVYLLISFQVTRSLPCRFDWRWKCNNNKFTVLWDVTPFSLVYIKDFEDTSVLFLCPQEERRVLHATAWEPEFQ